MDNNIKEFLISHPSNMENGDDEMTFSSHSDECSGD